MPTINVPSDPTREPGCCGPPKDSLFCFKIKCSKRTVLVPCCPNRLSEKVRLDFSFISGANSCLDGYTTVLEWSVVNNRWQKTVPLIDPCGSIANEFRLACAGGTNCQGFELRILLNATLYAIEFPQSGCNCNPLDLYFQCNLFSAPNNGLYEVHATEFFP